MEESTPKKGIPVALVAGIAAVALLAVAACVIFLSVTNSMVFR